MWSREGGLIAHFMAAKSPPELRNCLLHGQRVTSRLSRAQRIPSHARGHSDKCHPRASVADLPGCLHLPCKSKHLEINSGHRQELFQQSRACQERGYVDRVAVPAVPAPGIAQLEPLFTEHSARSTAHLSIPPRGTESVGDTGEQQRPLGLSQIAGRSKECLEPRKSSVWSFPQFPHLQLSLRVHAEGGGTLVCKQSLLEKGKSGGKRGKAVRKVKRKKMGTGEMLCSECM